MPANHIFKKIINYNMIFFWIGFFIFLIFIYHKIFLVPFSPDEYMVFKYIMHIKNPFDINLFMMAPYIVAPPVFSTHLFLLWLIYKILFLGPFTYRIIGFVSFLISVFLVYIFSLSITKDKRISLFTTILYSLSWWHTEILLSLPTEIYTSYIFIFLSFLLYINKRFIFSCFAYLLSLTFNTHGILLPFALIFYMLIYDSHFIKNKRAILAILIDFAIGASFLIGKYFFIKTKATVPLYTYLYQIYFSPINVIDKFILFLKGFLYPITNLIRYLFALDKQLLLILYLMFTLLSGLIFYNICKYNKIVIKIISFSMGWFFIFIGIFLFLLNRFSFYYMTISSVGLYLIFSTLIIKGIKYKLPRYSFILLIFIYMATFVYKNVAITTKDRNIASYLNKIPILSKN